MVRRRAKDVNKTIPVEDYEHSEAKRTNNPPAGLAHLDRDATPVRHARIRPALGPSTGLGG
jgi:hypothetical protein